MKLKTTGLLTLVSVLGFSAAANANPLFDIYVGATVGAGAATMFNGSDNDTEPAMSFGAVVGMDIPLLRVELEYDYLNDDAAKMHVGMLNAYFKMPSTVVKPYLGVGLGTVFNDEIGNDIDIRNKAAYQGMLGLTFDIPVIPFDVDVEARALYAPNLYTNVSNDRPDLLHYDLRLKLRYIF